MAGARGRAGRGDEREDACQDEAERPYTLHPAALCESDDVGAGTRIWEFAHVMAGAHVGSECNIGSHVFVEAGAWVGDRVTVKNFVMICDGVRIEDDAFVGPGVMFTNDRYPRSPRMQGVPEVAARYADAANWREPTVVGRGVCLGAGARVGPGVTIGACASIAMGALVVRDVPAHALVLGNPGRQMGWVCACGRPLASEPASDGSAAGRLVCKTCGNAYRAEGDAIVAQSDGSPR